MLIICVSALLSFYSHGVNVQDDDRILQGKLIEADTVDRIVTFVTDEGLLAHIAFDASSQVFNLQGLSSSGFQDPCLKRGTPIKVILHKSRHIIKELHCLAAVPLEDAPGQTVK